jgi:hypothetical protein
MQIININDTCSVADRNPSMVNEKSGLREKHNGGYYEILFTYTSSSGAATWGIQFLGEGCTVQPLENFVLSAHTNVEVTY